MGFRGSFDLLVFQRLRIPGSEALGLGFRGFSTDLGCDPCNVSLLAQELFRVTNKRPAVANVGRVLHGGRIEDFINFIITMEAWSIHDTDRSGR